ncbi:hypothetical protein N9539_02310 [Amylibacter sp.]|nr:hypothetical protein [Amylibacter sp.]
MIQFLKTLLATIVVALNFTYPANADAQQKFSFQGVSYNGDIKPEQFSFSDVIIKARSSTDRVNIKVTFQDVSTPYKATDKDETVAITFEGDPQSETVYALRLEYGTFFQEIPKEFSYENKANRHLISTRSIEDGSFNTLYEQLTDDDKVKVKGACYHFMDDKNIDNITSFKSPTIEGSKLKFPSSVRIDKIILSPNASKQIKALATLCFEATNRVYVKDVQAFLNASGHDVGKSDGLWGKKSQKGWEAYLTSQGKPLDTAINTKSVQELVSALKEGLPKLRKMNFRDGFFDTESELKKHTNERGGSCKYIDCELTIKEKLEARKTINAFRAWSTRSVEKNKYRLMWDGGTNMRFNSNKSINLYEVYWNYNYVGKPWSYYPGIEKYLTKRNWSHDAEYGKTVANKIIDPNYQDFIVDVMVEKQKRNNTDGIMVDWWHNNHQSSSGYSKHQVRMARTAIAKKLRAKIGPEKIILGNVNWRKDTATVPYINGVFLELYKKPSKSTSNRLYNSQELRNMESLLNYYEEKLQAPKLIALEGWRKTKSVSNEDRNTPENRKMAKLLTAMSVVIPTNGYILYADNNNDTPDGDHAHLFYDFYSFDIGKPTSGYNKVKSGVGYKEHDKGFIAYNITGSSKKFKRKNGQEHTIEAKSGLFCKDVGAKTECLSNN